MRVISGKLRGLKLNTFEYDNIRPTLDKVRESVFNKIQFGIRDARFLDLFAGTGVFSIEAYSRGAKVIYTVDSNKDSIKLIKSNLNKAKITNEIILLNDDYVSALHSLKNKENKFDYIFIDPPFNSDYGNNSINIILGLDLLDKQGVIIYEHSIDTLFDLPQNATIFDEKKYGGIVVSYIGVKND